MIRRPIILVGGFLQVQGSRNGIIRLWDDLCRLTSGDSETRVFWYPWNANASDIAEMIFRFRPEDDHEVILIGYSWGGTLVLKIARELKKRGIRVTLMVLCDAIYRAKILKFLAFAPCIRLSIPKTTHRVQSFRQENSRLRGHKIHAPKNVKFKEFMAPNTEHRYMDDLAAFYNFVIGEISNENAICKMD